MIELVIPVIQKQDAMCQIKCMTQIILMQVEHFQDENISLYLVQK